MCEYFVLYTYTIFERKINNINNKILKFEDLKKLKFGETISIQYYLIMKTVEIKFLMILHTVRDKTI